MEMERNTFASSNCEPRSTRTYIHQEQEREEVETDLLVDCAHKQMEFSFINLLLQVWPSYKIDGQTGARVPVRLIVVVFLLFFSANEAKTNARGTESEIAA